MIKKAFADGSGAVESRADNAFVRMLDAFMRLGQNADRVVEVLDNTTVPGTRFKPKEDDSLVIAISELVPANTD